MYGEPVPKRGFVLFACKWHGSLQLSFKHYWTVLFITYVYFQQKKQTSRILKCFNWLKFKQRWIRAWVIRVWTMRLVCFCLVMYFPVTVRLALLAIDAKYVTILLMFLTKTLSKLQTITIFDILKSYNGKLCNVQSMFERGDMLLERVQSTSLLVSFLFYRPILWNR